MKMEWLKKKINKRETENRTCDHTQILRKENR